MSYISGGSYIEECEINFLLTKFISMENSSKISFNNPKHVIGEEELKQVIGGRAAKDDCNGKDKSACFGTCTAEVAGSLKQGKCEWATYPAPIGSDCFCTIR
jgi:hypothetical protein